MASTTDISPSSIPFPTAQSVESTPPKTSASGAGDPANNEMLQRVVQGAHQTIDRLADTAAPHVQKLQEQVAGASEALNAKASDIRALGDEWVGSMRCNVREHPLVAVGAALALGMLIARLSR